MQEGVCPKCAAATVYGLDPSWDEDRRLALGMFSSAKISMLICTSCGYLEQYLLNPADRAKIQSKGQPIAPAAGGAERR